MIGSYLADVLEHLALCGTNHIHHIFVVSPFLTLLQHLLEEALALSILRELEIVRAFVGSERQQNHPFVLVLEERCNAVFAHVRGNGQCIHIVLLEEGTGVHLGGVADIATLCIGDDEVVGVVLLQILHRFLERHQTLYAVSLVESQIGLVGYAVIGRCVDDGLIKLKERIVQIEDTLGHLLGICIQSHAQKTLLLLNLFYQFFTIHIFIFLDNDKSSK